MKKLILIFPFILSGCYITIPVEDINRSHYDCKNNLGLNRIEKESMSTTVTAVCNNNARFTYTSLQNRI